MLIVFVNDFHKEYISYVDCGFTGASRYIRMSWKSSFISVIQLKL